MSRSTAGLGALALVALLPSAVGAHALPFGTRLVWPDAASTAWPLLVTNRGLVFADERDGKLSYSIRCQDAYRANPSDRASVFVQDDGTITVGVYYEIFQTRDRGCSVTQSTGLPELPISNPVADVGTPGRLFLTTRNLEQVAGVYVSEDYGATWNERFRNNEKEYYDQLMVAPSDSLTLYATGSRVDAEEMLVTWYCARSRDAGATWQNYPMPAKVIAFAVHPSDAEVVFAHRATDKLETSFDILRSEDGGQTFTVVLEAIRRPSDLVGTADGATLFLGADSNDGGLYRSRDGGRSFERVLPGSVQRVTCLAEHGGKLWMCGNLAPNNEGVWVSDDEGDSFQIAMTFADVTQPVLCDAPALALCAGDWYDFDREVRPAGADAGADPEPEVDAGSAPSDAATVEDPEDAGLAADAEVSTKRSESSGCQLQPAGSTAAGAPLVGMVWAWAWSRRRKRALERSRPRQHR